MEANNTEADNSSEGGTPSLEAFHPPLLRRRKQTSFTPDSVKSLCLQDRGISREAFYAQAILIYIICVACIVNLSIGSEHSSVWVSLLSGALGYILPSPRITVQKKNKIVDINQSAIP